MKILFLCSRNRQRSLTAERLFDGRNGHTVRSAGTERDSRIKVTGGMIGWADVIYCMEKKHLCRIREKFPEAKGKNIVCLKVTSKNQRLKP